MKRSRGSYTSSTAPHIGIALTASGAFAAADTPEAILSVNPGFGPSNVGRRAVMEWHWKRRIAVASAPTRNSGKVLGKSVSIPSRTWRRKSPGGSPSGLRVLPEITGVRRLCQQLAVVLAGHRASVGPSAGRRAPLQLALHGSG